MTEQSRTTLKDGRSIIYLYTAATSALYLFIVLNIPLMIISTGTHDDAFFMSAAKSILAWHWFGDYSQMTLIKGETYSLFIALSHILRINISLTTGFLFVFSNILFTYTLFMIHRRIWLYCLMLPILLYHPALMPFRVIRDAIYAPVTLILLACAIQLLFLAQTTRRRLGWGIATGVSMAAFWYTREEGIWIAPALAVMIAVQLLRSPARWSGVVSGGATAAILLMGIAALNYINYGSFVLVEFAAKPFSSTLGLLQSVRVGDPVPKVPVPQKVREELYRESPAFRELRPYFEQYGTWWTNPGCSTYPQTCGDYAGGWFMWALRDAVAWAGHYKTPQDANAYYLRLSAEVQAACNDRRLSCHASRLPFVPELSADDLKDLPDKLYQIKALVLTPRAFAPMASRGSAEELRADDELLGYPLRYPSVERDTLHANGWFMDPAGRWLEIRCDDGRAPIAVERQPSPDLVSYFNNPDAGNNRFDLRIDTMPQSCTLRVQGEASEIDGVKLTTLQPGAFQLGGKASQLQIDSVDGEGGIADWKWLNDAASLFSDVYEVVITVLLSAMVATLVLALSFDRARFFRDRDTLFLSLSLILAVATRLIIILLVDLSSFPAINQQYASALFPLFSAALLLPLVLLSRESPARSASAGDP